MLIIMFDIVILKEIYSSLKDLREDFDFLPGTRPFIMQEGY